MTKKKNNLDLLDIAYRYTSTVAFFWSFQMSQTKINIYLIMLYLFLQPAISLFSVFFLFSSSK